MNTHTWRYSATLSGHSALDEDEWDVMSEMPNEELFGGTSKETVDFHFLPSVLLATTRLQMQ